MDLNYYNKFKKIDKKIPKAINKEIWSYTRVSSIGQSENFSIEAQEENISNYANLNGYTITKKFGETYESASNDNMRKEFQKLLKELKQEKKKPYAVAIRTINRFSRTGASAISISSDLIEKLGVHLIETDTGLCTDNELDRITIFSKLLESRKQNIERVSQSTPGMRSFLKMGNWLGRAPRGYKTYGPKVSNRALIRGHQEIVVNDEGPTIKKAWEWKGEGMRDSEIINKLDKEYNFKISKQSLSQMWRRPFYCGILVHDMLVTPVKGKWKPLINQKLFKKVQDIIADKPRKSGYEISPVNEHRPLTGFLVCSLCNLPITSYIQKKKQIHYYKCQKCQGGNMNAISTPRSVKVGVNDSFHEFLAQYELKQPYADILKSQLIHLMGSHHKDNQEQQKTLERELHSIKIKIEKIDEKYLLSETLDEQTYLKVKRKFDKQLSEISEKIKWASNKLSNQENLIERALDISQNISKYWASGDIYKKIRIQECVFPGGLLINPQNREYRTKKMNGLFSVIADVARDSRDIDNKKATQMSGLSNLVAGTGLEPATFGL